jgi:Fe-S-cluster-containing hydrogenase component 2
MMGTRLRVTASRCTGCKLCEVVCSKEHTGCFQPTLSRIRISADHSVASFAPGVCIQCPDAPCITSCPTGALLRPQGETRVLFNRHECSACEACASACPYGGIFIAQDGYLILCDLCAGRALCVNACPTGALEWGE